MNILLLGPQGSGKGTQARLLAQKFGLFYFEAGEFLRELAVKNNDVKRILDSGKLVPEVELTSYIAAFFDEQGIWNNILFDGFPRSTEQYLFFKKWLKEKNIRIDLVVILEVSERVTLERLTKRAREDDTTDAIKTRLALYKKETVPLIDELRKDTKVILVDGERTVEAIQGELERTVKSEKN